MTDYAPGGPVSSGTDDEPEMIVPLDQHVDLLRRYTEAKKAKDGWAKIEEQLRKELEHLIGDAETATVNGEPAVTWSRTTTFQTGEFKKAEPELHQLYQMDKVVQVLDVDWLRKTRPDVYRRFQSRRFVNKFEAP